VKKSAGSREVDQLAKELELFFYDPDHTADIRANRYPETHGKKGVVYQKRRRRRKSKGIEQGSSSWDCKYAEGRYHHIHSRTQISSENGREFVLSFSYT